MSAALVPVVRAKDGVRFDLIDAGGFRILAAIWGATQALSVDLTLSCGTEGHPLADPHTRGDAYDIRVAGLETSTVVNLYRFLARELGPFFTVLYEVPSTDGLPQELADIAYVNTAATGPHVHVQVKRGTTYPPTAGAHA